ncbi:ADP-ribosylation factor GTPase-activating protein [Seminavis robusta]|uniref:ADP-ribosylation factor GTPase-activating protein n=1 Tax=Seminavis robusta TaxID=568900 RepID=A0A9N8EIQ9_9STRA|nr:ADP-ribosylation factor GTPase-activating protein [Seminavis robusta]|eukprot:Sro1144_g246090.1 ADP-ribosylation factor GTPase-activating protein (1113) ;mRNA; r:16065-19674
MHLFGGRSKKDQVKKRLNAIVALPTNRTCSDCPEVGPSWASILLAVPTTATGKKLPRVGVLCCYRCYTYHIELGKDVCRTKNILKPDEWTEEDLEIMERGGGNDYVNVIYESNLSPIVYDKQVLQDDMDADAAARREFVRNKYQHFRYFNAELFESQITSCGDTNWRRHSQHQQKSSSVKPTHALSKRSQSYDGPPPRGGFRDGSSKHSSLPKRPAKRRSMSFHQVGDEDEEDARPGYNLPGHLGVKSKHKELGSSSSSRGRKSSSKQRTTSASTEKKRRSLSSQRKRSSSAQSNASTASTVPSDDDLGSSHGTMDMSSISETGGPSIIDTSQSMGSSSSSSSSKRKPNRQRGSTELSQLSNMRGSMRGGTGTTSASGMEDDSQRRMGTSSSSSSRWGSTTTRSSAPNSQSLDASLRMADSSVQHMDATARRTNRRRLSMGMIDSSSRDTRPPATRLHASSAHCINRKPQRTNSHDKGRPSPPGQRSAAATEASSSKTSAAPRKPRRYCSSGEDSDVACPKKPETLKAFPPSLALPTGRFRRRKSLPSLGAKKDTEEEEDSIVCQYAEKKYTGIDVYSPRVRRGSLGLSSGPPKKDKGRTAYGVRVGYGFDSCKSSDSEHEKKSKRSTRSSSETNKGVALGIEAPALECFLKSIKKQPKNILDERSLGSGTKSSNEEILGIGPAGKPKRRGRRKSMGDLSVSSGSQLSSTSQGLQQGIPEVPPLGDSSNTNGEDADGADEGAKRRGSTGSNSATLSNHIDASKHPQSLLSDGQSVGGLSGFSFGSRSSGFESRSSEEEIDFSARRRPVADRLSTSTKKSFDWARHYTVSTDDESESEKQSRPRMSDQGYRSEDQVGELLAIATKAIRAAPSKSSLAWASEFTVDTDKEPTPDVPSRADLGYDDEGQEDMDTRGKKAPTKEDLGYENCDDVNGYAMPQHAAGQRSAAAGEPMDSSLNHSALRRRSSSNAVNGADQSSSMASFKTAQQGSSLGSMGGSGMLGQSTRLSASFKSAHQGSSVGTLLCGRGSLLRQDSSGSVASEASEASLNASLLYPRYAHITKGEDPPPMIPMAADESTSSAESFNRSSINDGLTVRKAKREYWRSALGPIASQH